MMAVVVVDGDAADLALALEAASDAAKGCEALDDRRRRETRPCGRGGNPQRICGVGPPGRRESDGCLLYT
jgi:hypothetical protein